MKKNFLIPGHAVALYDKVYIGNTLLGTVIERAFQNQYDFAYVENNGNTATNKLPNGNTLPLGSAYSDPPQGLNLSAYGCVSGKQSGKILSVNYSNSIDGVAVKGMLKTSYKAVHRDSGAPVWSSDSPIGMQSASALSSNGASVSGSFTICTVLYEICKRGSVHDIYLTIF